MGRFAFSSGGSCIVQAGIVTKRHNNVATKTKGKNTVAKAKAIWKSLQIECALVVGFSNSSSLQDMLVEVAIASISTSDMFVSLTSN
jgi:hypothetical protein